MKSAQPRTNAEPSAQDSAHSIGRFPARRCTVAAEVLRRVLEGERLTSLAAVFDSSTTRLSAVVHYLKRDYGWNFAHADLAVGTRDGRVQVVREYFLSAGVRECAKLAGADVFCYSVLQERASRRAGAGQARSEAARRNAAARPLGSAAQLGASGLGE